MAEPITFEANGQEREALMACATYLSGAAGDPSTAVLLDADDSRRATPADLIAALAQNDALLADVLADKDLRAKVLRAVLPSAEELAKRLHDRDERALSPEGPWRGWDEMPNGYRRVALSDAAVYLRALGVGK